MATRRKVPTNLTEKEASLVPKPGPSDTRPAVPTSTLVKLLGFTFAMIILPIGSYFLTVKTIFSGNSTYAGALAALMANVVLLGYVLVAMSEDQSDALEEAAARAKGELEREAAGGGGGGGGGGKAGKEE